MNARTNTVLEISNKFRRQFITISLYLLPLSYELMTSCILSKEIMESNK